MTNPTPTHRQGTRNHLREILGDRRPIRRVDGDRVASLKVVSGRAAHPAAGRGRPPTSRSAGPPHGGSGHRGRVLSLPVLGAQHSQHRASPGPR